MRQLMSLHTVTLLNVHGQKSDFINVHTIVHYAESLNTFVCY